MNHIRADLMRIVAIIANLLMIALVGFLAAQAYGRDTYLALLLMIPPVLSIIALFRMPDAETRMLEQAVTKARLRRELADLGVITESDDEEGTA
jgi:hypothetical protein